MIVTPKKHPKAVLLKWFVRFAGRLATVAEHAQSMAHDRLSPEDRATDLGVDSAYGCACGVIFDCRTFLHPHNYPTRVKHCPSCGKSALTFLGTLPFLTTNDQDQVFLMNEEGRVAGPYESEAEAYENLWSWFNGKEGGKKARRQKGQRQKGNCRLIAQDGELLGNPGVRDNKGAEQGQGTNGEEG